MLELIIQNIHDKLYKQNVIVACSTGLDSTCLLDLVMKALPKEQIIICHVNHQKRTSSIKEEAYIQEYAKKHQIKCYVKKLENAPHANFQEWARIERYNFFQEVADKEACKYILLAHHANDNLETIIMRLIKSSSLKGYAGIEEETKLPNSDVYLYRPLLSIPKTDLANYAKENNLKYFEDESNQTKDYTRNRIRHQITPILLEENPNLYEAINYYSNTILNANQLLENEKIKFIENKVLVNNKNEISFQLKDFQALTAYLQIQILFRLLRPYSLSHNCIMDIIKQINSNKNRIITMINPKLALIKEYQTITLGSFSLEPLEYKQLITEYGVYNLPNNQTLEVLKNISYFTFQNGKIWYNTNMLPLTVRTRVSGDKIKTNEGTISVSDFLTNRKVPYLKRKDLLLLCDNQNNIIAILGYVIKMRKENTK